mgnify:CR=1 FL=1
MTDKELLELAAKAAGYNFEWFGQHFHIGIDERRFTSWNPLTDDGDALRLAVKLRLTLQHNYSGVYCYDSPDFCDKSQTMIEVYENDIDIYAATRRAIVRAAAEIGKSL